MEAPLLREAPLAARERPLELAPRRGRAGPRGGSSHPVPPRPAPRAPLSGPAGYQIRLELNGVKPQSPDFIFRWLSVFTFNESLKMPVPHLKPARFIGGEHPFLEE